MDCLVLHGSGRRIAVGSDGVYHYRLEPGESFIGEFDPSCAGAAIENRSETVDEKLAKEGLHLGDAIAWVTKKVGIKQCAPCKARQEILNHAAALGWSETIRQIKETF